MSVFTIRHISGSSKLDHEDTKALSLKLGLKLGLKLERFVSSSPLLCASVSWWLKSSANFHMPSH